MDFKQGAERATHTGGPAAHKPAGSPKKKTAKKVIGAVVISIVLIAVLTWSTLAILTKTGVVGANSSINKDDYQAVFLTNGQVYFGKLKNAQGEYLTLSNIYYLQVDSSIQSGTTEAEDVAASDSNVQLIKLGNELHGPRDEMQISNQQVLFWENLKQDSKVSEAINNYDE